MSAINPLITTAEEQFVVGESDFSYFNNYANRCEGGAILFCRKGSAHVTVNQYGGLVKRNTLVLILPGSVLMLTGRTEDFRVITVISAPVMSLIFVSILVLFFWFVPTVPVIFSHERENSAHAAFSGEIFGFPYTGKLSQQPVADE